MIDERRPVDIEDAISHRVLSEPRISPDGKRLVFSLGWASKVGEHAVASLWLTNTDGRSITRLTSGESNDSNPQWSPDGSSIAFVSDRANRGTGALFLINADGGEAIRISSGDATVADPQWSPDGTRITVRVTDQPTDDERDREARRDDVIVHGERERHDRLCIFDVPASPFSSEIEPVAPRRLVAGDWHVWEHAWSPDGTRIALTISERPGMDETFDRVLLALVSADGGEPRTIHGEAPGFRAPSALAWSPTGDQLAFLAAFDLERDAGKAMYTVEIASETVTRQFTDEVGTLLGLAWPRDDAFIVHRLLGVHSTFWTLPVDAQRLEIATGSPMSEGGALSLGGSAPSLRSAINRSGDRFAAIWSNATTPQELWTGDLRGGTTTQLTRFNERLAGRAFGRTEIMRWTADDGQEIEGLLIYPVDYTEGTRYPTILHIHGGPSWAWDDHLYASWHDWGQILAGRGYAVLLPNPRGSTGRGWQFQIANWNDWMGADYQDSLSGIDDLIGRGIADPDRLGIGGWSYGGRTTAWALTQTNRFKAGIVGAGATNRVSMRNTTDVIRWNSSWVQTDFAESPDEYWRTSAIRFVGQVSTPTLVLHGENDARVPVSQGWEYYNALRYAGVPTTIAVYPREPHIIGEREHQRDILERVIGWFDEHLK